MHYCVKTTLFIFSKDFEKLWKLWKNVQISGCQQFNL